VKLKDPHSAQFLEDGTVLICDSGNHRLVYVDETGNAVRCERAFSAGLERFKLNRPRYAQVGPGGVLVVVDTGNNRVLAATARGEMIWLLTSVPDSPQQRAFGATERYKMQGSDGAVSHAEMQVGDSVIMLGQSPDQTRTTHSMLYLYVPDVDSAFKKAVDAGAKATMPPADMFWGDRFGKLADPFGHEWSMATHKEDLTHEEIEKRGKAFMASMPSPGA
jgi:PhnB protein